MRSGCKLKVKWIPILLTCAILAGCINDRKQMGGPKANYPQFIVYGVSTLSTFSTSSRNGIAEVYVQMPDGSRHFLPDLTENVVIKSSEKQDSITPNNPRTRYSDGLTTIIFKNGVLRYVHLEAGLATWKIAAKEEGPYLALPISKTDLVKHFGEPDSWDVYVPPRGP